MPANRFVDGLPAYAQCAGTTGAVWSNNGIDTSATSQGTGWVKTQDSGGYQCTELAWRYMHFTWNIDYRSGNAGSWCDGKLPATLTKAAVPVHGDLIVFAPGVCGSDATTGHIAVIDVVNTAGRSVTLVEENEAGRRSAQLSCGLCFLHAVANTGSTSGGAGGAGAAGNAGNAGNAGALGGSPATAGGAGGVAFGGSPSSAGVPGLAGSGGSRAETTASGGSPVAGAPSASTGGVLGLSGNAGQGNAGTAGFTPDHEVDQNASCGMVHGAPTHSRGVLGQFALLLVGLIARRRMLRQKG